MTFLHKLAQRLARLKAALLLGIVATIACEVPLADPSLSIGRLQLSPKSSTVRAGQTTQFTVVALTPSGDTATMSVRWAVTGGSMVDSSTNGGKHYLQYRSPSEPGQYKVVTQTVLAALSDSAFITVTTVPVAAVSVSPTATSLTALQSVQLTALAVDSVGGILPDRVVTWASNNPAIATVNAIGLVTGVSAGTVTLTATSEGKNGTATVTVSPAPVASVTMAPTAVSVTIAQTAQLTATPRDANGTALIGRVVTWGSGNTGVATVNGSGLVTGVAAGTTVITAMSEGKSVTAAITVTSTPAPVASVSVSPTSANLSTGQTVQLTATPLDAGGSALFGRVVTWSSGNSARATVSGSGLVTGLTAGAVTITATSEGQSGSSAITVTAPVATVSVSPTPTSVSVGQTVQLTATPRDVNGIALVGRVVTWGSSNNNVATVNGSGLVTGVASGSVTITATSESRNGTAAVTVTPTPVASVSVSPASPSVAAGQAVQLTATPRSASGAVLTGRVVTWASGNTGIATVSSNGLVTGVTAGSVTITATSEGQSGTSAVTVTPPPAGGNWPNAPAGWSTVLNTAFGTGDGWNYYGPKVVTDPTGPTSSNVLQFTFPAGHPGGSSPGPIERLWPNGVTSHYAGFWIKLSNPFDNRFGVKTWYPGPGGGYFVVIEGDDKGGDAGTLRIEGGLKNWDSNISNTKITPGVWHRVEVLFMNGSNLKMWVDGTLVANHNISWTVAPPEARFYPVWGGTGNSMAFTSYMWIDHIFLSRP